MAKINLGGGPGDVNLRARTEKRCKLELRQPHMKVAITGASGLFGYGLVEAFRAEHEVFALTRAEADLTIEEEVRNAFAKVRPEIVIHAGAIADLDICETEPSRAFFVNVHGTRYVVEAARAVGASVAYVSTDAVFDGKNQTPYTESDLPNPPTVYGRTKLKGEQIVRTVPSHWIFRVSVLFGPGKTNFVEKGLRKIAGGEKYEVAADQLGSATCTLDAARKMMEVVEARRYGLYHLSNQGACTRYDLARSATELAGLDPGMVVDKPSDELGRPAKRLRYAVMEMAALKQAGFALPRPWRKALAEYLAALGSLENLAKAASRA